MHTDKKKLAVFISGSGTNFQAVQEYILNNKVNGQIVLLVSSNAGAKGIQKAEQYNIDTCVIQMQNYPEPDSCAKEIKSKLAQHKIDYIILAGFLKKVPLEIIQQYKNKIINIHPALLPKFGGKGMYGIHIHEAVLQAGEKETGPTVHFVDEVYDHGPIIMQHKIPVYSTDSPQVLQKRVLEEEHKILPHVVELLCNDKIKIENNKVIIEN